MRRYAVLSFFLIPLVVAATLSHSDEYRRKKVDATRITGQYKVLVLDEEGLPHIVYWDQTHDLIQYAHRNGTGLWEFSTVPTAQTGYVYSAAIDDSGYIHFVFKGTEGEDTLYYGVKREDWDIDALDDSTGSAASIVIDSEFKACVAYYFSSGGNEYLAEASKDGANWQFDTLGPGINPSAAVDRDDNVHIAYQVPDQWIVKYRGLPAIDTLVGPGGVPSLEVDSAGIPHISCLYLGAVRKLRYYHWDGSQWQSEDVDSVGRIGPSDLALSSSGVPHIAYKTDRALKHATLSGTWEIEQIDTTMLTGPYLQLSELGSPHVCYDSGTYNFLMYAWVPDSQYTKILVDPDSFYFVYGSYTTKAPAEDGNNAGCFRDLNEPTWMEAVELPVAVACSLTELHYFPCNAQNPPLHWKVWGDDGGRPGDLLGEGTENPTVSNQWITIEVDPAMALDPGNVYVGWSADGAPYYWNGHDAALEDTTNWWWNGATWVKDRYILGNLLVRAVLWIPEAHPTAAMLVMNDGYQVDLEIDSIGYDAPWIEFLSHSAFALAHDSVQVIELGVNAEGLNPGIYVDSLLIYSNDPNIPEYPVPIIFQVDTMTNIQEEIPTPPSPGSVAIALIRPNPMRDVGLISYSVPKREIVSVKIYNALGALVRTLVDEEREAGVYTSTWDGRDNSHREVAPGVYWTVLKTCGVSEARKVILIR